MNVNGIAHGYMNNHLTEALRNDQQRNKAISERILAGRWGEASDPGGATVFLASAVADYVHGQLLVVDGGWMAR